MATHSCNLAWEIPWTEEPGGLQSMGLQRVGHDLVIKPPPLETRIWVWAVKESKDPNYLQPIVLSRSCTLNSTDSVCNIFTKFYNVLSDICVLRVQLSCLRSSPLFPLCSTAQGSRPSQSFSCDMQMIYIPQHQQPIWELETLTFYETVVLYMEEFTRYSWNSEKCGLL